MEIIVLEAEGLPNKPIMAINAGRVRRQAELEVNQPIHIPKPGSESGTISLQLLQQLASETLVEDSGDEPDVECTIPVPQPSGAPPDAVKLLVQRARRSTTPTAARGAKGLGLESCAGSIRDTLGATLSTEYLSTHKRLQDLLQEVLRTQPENPYKYMLKHLKEVRRLQGRGFVQDPGSPTSVTCAAPPATTTATEAPTNITLMPRPPGPGAPPRGTGSPRKVRHFAQVGQGAQQIAAPLVTQEPTAEECRRAVHMQMAPIMASGILRKAIIKEVTMLQIGMDVRNQAKASLRHLYQKSAVLLSSEYKQAVTRWALGLTIRGAVDKIVQDAQMERDCIDKDDGVSRRMSMPTPIVSLGADRTSWGAWLR